MKNKKVFIVIIVLMLAIIAYLLIKINKGMELKKENDKYDVFDSGKTLEKIDVQDNKISNYEFYSYSNIISPEDSETGEEFYVFKSIYLLSNGKYYYSYVDYGDNCTNWNYGNYIISSNKLILTPEYRGDCDECYYKNYLSNVEFSVEKDKLISEEKEVLNKVPDDENLQRYTFNIDDYKECK